MYNISAKPDTFVVSRISKRGFPVAAGLRYAGKVLNL